MNTFIHRYKDLLTILIALIALVFSGISFFRSCSYESKQEKTDYSISAIEHRPRIKLSSPQIQSLKFNTDSILPNNPENTDSIGEVFGKLELTIKLNATNIGNTSSKIIGWIIADTISDAPFLKNFIKNRKVVDSNTPNDLKIPHYYQELNPFDSCSLELNYSPQWIEKNKFVIHVLLLYENELNQLFDTYYWLTVHTKEPLLPNPIYFRNNPEKLKEFKSGIFEIVKIDDENNYSETYTVKEKKALIEKIE